MWGDDRFCVALAVIGVAVAVFAACDMGPDAIRQLRGVRCTS